MKSVADVYTLSNSESGHESRVSSGGYLQGDIETVATLLAKASKRKRSEPSPARRF